MRHGLKKKDRLVAITEVITTLEIAITKIDINSL